MTRLLGTALFLLVASAATIFVGCNPPPPVANIPDGGYCANDSDECVTVNRDAAAPEAKPLESITKEEAKIHIPGRKCSSDRDCQNADVDDYACLGGYCQLKSSAAHDCADGDRDGRNLECRKYGMFCGTRNTCQTPACDRATPLNFRSGEQMCQPERGLLLKERAERYSACYNSDGTSKCSIRQRCVGFFSCNNVGDIICHDARCRDVQSTPSKPIP